MLATRTPALAGLDYLTELADGLGWQPNAEVAMLWGYFDESGIHDPTTGRLTSLTIGGCIAPLDAWKAFCPLWQAALDTEPMVKCFHMAPFERWKKPYDWLLPDGTRDKARHEKFTNLLLDAIIPNVKMFVGYTNFVFDEDADDFEALYVKGIVDMIMHGIKDHYTTLGEQPVRKRCADPTFHSVT